MASKPTIAVLAGGLATRLGELTKSTPKSLISVNGRPFLAYQLELFAASGIDDVVLCIGHHGEQIVNWVEQHPLDGVRIRFSPDGPQQLGTGGAVMNALPLLGEVFLVTYGDSYLRCNYVDVYSHFLRAYEAAPPDARPLGLMTVFENEDRFDTSNVVFHEGRILRYDKRARVPEMRHIDWGLSVLTRAALAPHVQGERFDLADVFEALVESGRMIGFEASERFYEVGSISGLTELSSILASASA